MIQILLRSYERGRLRDRGLGERDTEIKIERQKSERARETERLKETETRE